MSTKICVVVSDDGQLSIGIEPPGEEMAEDMGEGMGQEGMEGGEDTSYLEPVADERELMMKLRELIASASQPNPEAQEGFERGFKRASGPPGVDMKGLMK